MRAATAPASTTISALGVLAQVMVVDDAVLDEAAELVRRELEVIDLACSRFRTDSELSIVNRSHGRTVEISPLLQEALAVALRAAAATDGDVDPTVGRSLRGLGWDRDFQLILRGAPGATFEIVPAGGWREIELDPQHRTVRVPRGVEIDLGATAKALVADRCAALVAAGTGTGALVNLGGDIAVAGEPPEGGWLVRVTDDHRSPPDAEGQTIAIFDGGLATSSTTVRRWVAGGVERHHIVDPGTGLPVPEIWRTVTVAAATCVGANVASTASIVRGEAAPGFLERQRLPARLVRPDGEIVTTSGWPQEDA